MNKYWYSCPEWHPVTNEDLWKHEYDKHGTCIPDDSVLEYFSNTLTIFQQAKENNWYGCCLDQSKQCLIPFSKKENRWLGWCHRHKKEKL